MNANDLKIRLSSSAFINMKQSTYFARALFEVMYQHGRAQQEGKSPSLSAAICCHPLPFSSLCAAASLISFCGRKQQQR